MRLCVGRVPHQERRWRLVHSLVEDGVLEAESEEEAVVTDIEEAVTESEEGDLSFMNETESWLESETETSESETEEELDWYGLMET